MLQSRSIKRVGGFMATMVAMLGLAWFAPTVARAQNTNSGTITGQVTDAQGKAIVGAVIMLTNASTNGAQPTVSNSAGRYVFVNVQPGTYSLDVKKDGFKEATVKSQAVAAGKPVTLNIPMQVGSATQTVEVTANGAELQTMNATVGETLSSDAIMKLPALNRDANSLTTLQPNTQPDGGVGGAASDQNSYTLDGGNNSNDMDGSNAVYTSATGGASSGVMPTPAESVSTFTVGVSNQSADVNSAAGSSVAMVTRRGTDAIHGSVYEYYLGSYLAANSWSNNQQGISRPKSHRNRFGASLGGEILPNWLGGKTYLFGNYEGLRYPLESTYTRAVPTPLLRAGVVQAQCGGAACANGVGVTPGTWGAYNLNPVSVTVGNTTYNPAVCNIPAANGGGTGPCDPLGMGMNPVVSQIWQKYMPLPNETTGGDRFNLLNFQGSVNDSQRSNFFVSRLDHDFGAKNHFTATYHFYSFNPISTAQVDIGGALPGDTFGVPTATTQRPQLPAMASAQLTTSISANVTNNFNYSYLRNYWEWLGTNLSPQTVSGFGGALGGALEIGGESSGAQIPYNLNTQSVRTRFWDGIGHTFSDDMTVIHGNHIIQFGGKYTHQWDYHSRNDNGGGIMANTVYQVGNGTGQSGGHGVAFNYSPTDFVKGATTSIYNQYYAETMGIVTQPQTMYTRAGQQLNLQPLGTHMFDQSTIPLYNVYFSDAWHIQPSLTLTYGTGYTIEMPPHEALGKQVGLVDASGNAINAAGYLAAEQRAALAGQAYAPTLAFATVNNIGAGLKYPYNPFYGSFSPRVSLAWNPNIDGGPLGWLFGGNKSVIRGGWSRIYGRLNGVDLVLVPLLGTGLGQPVSCIGASAAGACLGNGGVNPNTAFRIGPTAGVADPNAVGGTYFGSGMTAPLGAPPTATLPQPFFPGQIQNGVVNASAGSGEFLDPNFKPDRSDEFDLTFQRQLSRSFTTELGYTGRIIRNEYQAINLDAVPYMMTSGGQQFQHAFANLYQQIAAGATNFNPQSFFETALGGANSPYCKAYASCTAAVAAHEGPAGSDNIDPNFGNNVYGMWTDMSRATGSWQLGRTYPSAATTCSTPGVGACPANGVISAGGQLSAIFDNVSMGWGNYNSLFWSIQMRDWHGLTLQSNLTWSHSLGTGQVYQATSSYTVTNPWNIGMDYGPQFDDTPLNYNLYFIYEPGSKTQRGLMGHLVDGWSFAPILTWRRFGNNFFAGGSGTGVSQVTGGFQCGAFGETDCSAGSAVEGGVTLNGYTGGSGIVYNVAPTGVGSNSNPATGGTGINRFANPAAIMSEFRPLVLGLDTTAQSGIVPGLAGTNVDFSVTKDLALSERFTTELNAQATNVFNHFVPSSPYLDITNPANFGTISSNQLAPRTVEVGLLVRW